MKAAELDRKINIDFDKFQTLQSEKPIINLSPTFNTICGGFRGGSMVVMTGPEKSGKTITCLDFAKRAQQQGYKILYLNAEGRLGERDVKSCEGLDFSPDKFRIVTSTDEHKVSAEDFLKLTIYNMEKEEKLMVIADSLSHMSIENELKDEEVSMARDYTPSIISKFCKRIAPVLATTDHIFLAVVHQYANTSGYGKMKLESGGNKLKYAMDVKLTLKKFEVNKPDKDDNLIRPQEKSRKIEWLCETSNMGFPQMTGISYVVLGEGIDDVAELLPLAVETGVMMKGGKWFSYKDQKWDGEKKTIAALKENKELQQEITQEIEERLK